MKKEEQLTNALIIVSTALVSILRIVWDFLPRPVVRTTLQELRNCLQLVDRGYTITLLSDIDRVESLL